jgi:hypothetical protein
MSDTALTYIPVKMPSHPRAQMPHCCSITQRPKANSRQGPFDDPPSEPSLAVEGCDAPPLCSRRVGDAAAQASPGARSLSWSSCRVERVVGGEGDCGGSELGGVPVVNMFEGQVGRGRPCTCTGCIPPRDISNDCTGEDDSRSRSLLPFTRPDPAPWPVDHEGF